MTDVANHSINQPPARQWGMLNSLYIPKDPPRSTRFAMAPTHRFVLSSRTQGETLTQ